MSQPAAPFDASRHQWIAAATGPEANTRSRTTYLRPAWNMAMVRGTPLNAGGCLEYCIQTGDAPAAGHCSGCHSRVTKSGCPLGSHDQCGCGSFCRKRSGHVQLRGAKFWPRRSPTARSLDVLWVDSVATRREVSSRTVTRLKLRNLTGHCR